LIILFSITITVLAGVVLLFLRNRGIRYAWLVATLGLGTVLLLLIVSGPQDDLYSFPIWQVTRDGVLFAAFDLPFETWLLTLTLLIVGIAQATRSAGHLPSDRSMHLGMMMITTGLSMIALAAANTISLVLAWTLVDLATGFMPGHRNETNLNASLPQAGSILLLMAASSMGLPLQSGVADAVPAPILADTFILLSAFLRFLSGTRGISGNGGGRERLLNRTFFSVLSCGALIRYAPYALEASGLLLFIPLLGALVCFVGILFSNSEFWRRSWAHVGQLGLLLMGMLLPAEVQSGYFAGAGVLLLVSHRSFSSVAGWTRWLSLIVPLTAAGLPLTPGGVLLQHAAVYGIVPMVTVALFLGSAALQSWWMWLASLGGEPAEDIPVQVPELAGMVLVMLLLVFSGWQLGFSYQPFTIIIGIVLIAGTSFWAARTESVLEVSATDTPWSSRSRLLSLQLRRVHDGLFDAYGYGVRLVSDILEGDGGTLWIIILVLVGVLTIRSQV